MDAAGMRARMAVLGGLRPRHSLRRLRGRLDGLLPRGWRVAAERLDFGLLT
jgi:hypothetical protein